MDSGVNWVAVEKLTSSERWPVLTTCREAITWLEIQTSLGLAPRPIEAYARGLADYLSVCQREGTDPLTAGRAEIARYVRDLAVRPNRRNFRWTVRPNVGQDTVANRKMMARLRGQVCSPASSLLPHAAELPTDAYAVGAVLIER